MSFHWSLRPMVKWMHCIGIYLESPGVQFSRLSVTTFGFVLFFLNLFTNGINMAKNIQSFHMYSAGSWNGIITWFTIFLATIGSQLSLIIGSTSSWPGLIQILREMETERIFERKDFENFHRIFISGLGILMTVILVIFGIDMTIISSQNIPIIEILLQLVYSFVLIFFYSGGALFSCLGWMTANMLTILAERVNKSNCDDMDKMLAIWRKQYWKIIRLVDKTNQCFGSLLLVIITSSFVVLISSSFLILDLVIREGLGYNLFLNLLAFIIQFLYFVVLAYVPYRIQESAIHLSKQLRELEIDNRIQTIKVNFFVLNLLNSLPRITALGLFDVNLHLVPSIVGTTLTYLVILFQFHNSGK